MCEKSLGGMAKWSSHPLQELGIWGSMFFSKANVIITFLQKLAVV
jgi:hypothetical protein